MTEHQLNSQTCYQILFKHQDEFAYLVMRWNDECIYEAIADYRKSFRRTTEEAVEANGFKFRFRADGRKLISTITAPNSASCTVSGVAKGDGVDVTYTQRWRRAE